MFAARDDEMVECPYNPTHRMLRKRLQQHLLRCRINYPDCDLKKCPFNQTHLVPGPEFEIHVTRCPDRKLIAQYNCETVKQEEEEEEEERIAQTPIECEENWDDCVYEDYNPQLYAAHANVLRKPDQHQPAQRREFVNEERKRLGELPPTPSPPRISDLKDDSDDEIPPVPLNTIFYGSSGNTNESVDQIGMPSRSVHRGDSNEANAVAIPLSNNSRRSRANKRMRQRQRENRERNQSVDDMPSTSVDRSDSKELTNVANRPRSRASKPVRRRHREQMTPGLSYGMTGCVPTSNALTSLSTMAPMDHQEYPRQNWSVTPPQYRDTYRMRYSPPKQDLSSDDDMYYKRTKR